MFLLCIYVPDSHLGKVKDAVFDAGGGRIGDYDRCAWQVKGEGQFRPLVQATPYIGECGQSEVVVEYKLEVVVADTLIKPVIEAMKSAHPYEEPAFHYMKVNPTIE